MRVGIRGAVFQIGEGEQSAVTLSVLVADGFWHPIEGGGVTATILLTPDEARMVSGSLIEAAQAALDAAPPMYE
jgi:hypothetical protein